VTQPRPHSSPASAAPSAEVARRCRWRGRSRWGRPFSPERSERQTTPSPRSHRERGRRRSKAKAPAKPLFICASPPFPLRAPPPRHAPCAPASIQPRRGSHAGDSSAPAALDHPRQAQTHSSDEHANWCRGPPVTQPRPHSSTASAAPSLRWRPALSRAGPLPLGRPHRPSDRAQDHAQPTLAPRSATFKSRLPSLDQSTRPGVIRQTPPRTQRGRPSSATFARDGADAVTRTAALRLLACAERRSRLPVRTRPLPFRRPSAHVAQTSRTRAAPPANGGSVGTAPRGEVISARTTGKRGSIRYHPPPLASFATSTSNRCLAPLPCPTPSGPCRPSPTARAGRCPQMNGTVGTARSRRIHQRTRDGQARSIRHHPRPWHRRELPRANAALRLPDLRHARMAPALARVTTRRPRGSCRQSRIRAARGCYRSSWSRGPMRSAGAEQPAR
jgi:hypothetical protein